LGLCSDDNDPNQAEKDRAFLIERSFIMSFRVFHVAITAIVIGLAGSSDRPIHAQQPPPSAAAASSAIPSSALLQPNELVQMMRAQEKPLVLQVGSHVLFAEAHIPGSEYAGPTGSSAGIASLRDRVSGIRKDQLIVIYCGCCPWVRCPNIRPAYEQLQAMGFTRVRALYIENNFGKDWVDKGYPIEKGR
jgi:thiosulfate/3-mercaptopyruvate sulfurtransferase